MRGRILVCGSAFCRRRAWCARPDKMWLWEESATRTHACERLEWCGDRSRGRESGSGSGSVESFFTMPDLGPSVGIALRAHDEGDVRKSGFTRGSEHSARLLSVRREQPCGCQQQRMSHQRSRGRAPSTECASAPGQRPSRQWVRENCTCATPWEIGREVTRVSPVVM